MVAEKLAELIDQEVNSGELSLDKKRLQEIKRLCKSSQDCLKSAFDLLIENLRRDHAQVRWSCFLLIAELFERSHAFRELLIADLNEYLMLVAEIDPRKPLPLPKAAATRLKEKSVLKLKAWVDQYGPAYTKLCLGFNFLVETGKLKIPHLNATEDDNSSSRKSTESGPSIFDRRKAQEAETEIATSLPEIEIFLTELQNAFEILVPNFEALPPADLSSEPDPLSSTIDLRHHGLLPTQSYSIQVSHNTKALLDLNNPETSDLFDKISEDVSLLQSKYGVSITKWMSALSKIGSTNDFMKKCIDLKRRISEAIRKARLLGVDPNSTKLKKRKAAEESESSDEEDDFEEVPELDSTAVHSMYNDPIQTSSKHSGCSSISSFPPASELLRKKEAPVIAFGEDLRNWESSEACSSSSAVFRSGFDTGNYWSSKDIPEEFTNNDLSAALRMRTIPFVGKFEPITRSCRALLPNGTLCPRMDRVRCPFHGKIIDRDDMGVPINEAERIEEEKRKEKEEAEKIPEWQDPELLRDIQAATGLDLKVEKRKKRKRNPNLEDVEKIQDTPRSRLEKRVLSRGAVKRVGEQIESEMKKRAQEKFAHSWNYSMGTI